MILAAGIIYKITYPNGKIYIGQDRTDDINYFGSARGALIEQDFTPEQRRSFTITKEIIFQATRIELKLLNTIELIMIRHFGLNCPTVGYNRYPSMPKYLPKRTIYENSPR